MSECQDCLIVPILNGLITSQTVQSMGILSSALGSTLSSLPSYRSSFELSDIRDGGLEIKPLSITSD